MIKIDSMLKGKKTGHETVIVLSEDLILQRMADDLTDELETGPPILTDRGGLRSAIELIRSEGRTPLVLLWSTDMEEFGKDLGLEIIARNDIREPGSQFEGPTLSLISKHGPFWDRIPDRIHAVYDDRYARTAEDYIMGLKSGGLDISSSSVRGDIFSTLGKGEADIGIGMLRREDLLSDQRFWPLDRIADPEPVIARFP